MAPPPGLSEIPVDPGIVISVASDVSRGMMRDGRSRYGLAGASVGCTPLPRYPEIMWRASRFQFDVAGQRLIVEPVQHALVLVRSNHLLCGNVHSASHRNQQERMQRVCAQADALVPGPQATGGRCAVQSSY